MRELNLEKSDKILSMIQKLVTVSAIIVTGLWTYNMFILHRESYAKADISYQIEEIKLSDEYILIQVFIKVVNTGNTVLRMREGDVRLLDISFPNNFIEKRVAEFEKSSYRIKPTFNWETIQYVIVKWEKGEIEIEPSSIDQLDFEFIVKSKYKVIKVYSWFTNLEKKIGDRWIGWTGSTIYNVKL